MRDVAALAKVSLKTVSRVVNGETGVSPRLAKRVMTARDRLGYRHDLTASSLRRSDGRSLTIGVVLEDVSTPLPRRCTGRSRTSPWSGACLCLREARTRTKIANASWFPPSSRVVSTD